MIHTCYDAITTLRSYFKSLCFIVTSTCGATILQNGTLFRNPDYPTKYRPTGSDFCQVRIRKQYNICQLRLNFIQLDLDGPSTGVSGTAGTSVASGMCNTDAFTISSTGAAIPTVCGQLQGQHSKTIIIIWSLT